MIPPNGNTIFSCVNNTSDVNKYLISRNSILHFPHCVFSYITKKVFKIIKIQYEFIEKNVLTNYKVEYILRLSGI